MPLLSAFTANLRRRIERHIQLARAYKPRNDGNVHAHGDQRPQQLSHIFALIMALLVGKHVECLSHKEGLYARDFLSWDHTETTED